MGKDIDRIRTTTTTTTTTGATSTSTKSRSMDGYGLVLSTTWESRYRIIQGYIVYATSGPHVSTNYGGQQQ
jgi:hypothetical protein